MKKRQTISFALRRRQGSVCPIHNSHAFGATKLALAAMAALPLWAAGVSHAQLSLGTTAVTQNFDSIGATATATLPTYWKADTLTTNPRTLGTYAAAGTATTATGGPSISSTATGGIYNFGSGTTNTGTDRAVGFLGTSTIKSGNLYTEFTASAALSGINISYNVEKYRNGTNAAGFSIQMYYSTDGSTWTSAGSNFLTSFAADANSNGATPVPTTTVNVNNTFTLSIATGSNLYLAWNYAVTSGTTTSSAQALGLDDFSFTGVASTAPATYTYFDVNGSTSGSGVANGGTYTFSGTHFNSAADGTGATGAFTSGSTAIFSAGTDGGTSSYTVNIDTAVSANGLTFNSGNVTLANASGGSLTLTGAAVSVTSGATATISQAIGGSVGLNKSGAGTLTLSGSNLYTGGTTVAGGILSVSSDPNLGDASGGITLGGGTLQTTASFSSTRTLDGTGSLAPAAGTTFTISGAVGGTTAGVVTLSDAGTVALTAATGTTKTINSLVFSSPATVSVSNAALAINSAITSTQTTGTATISGPVALSSGTHTVTVADGSASTDLLLSGNLSGAAVIAKVGTGTLELTGDNSALTGTGTTPASVRIGAAATSNTANPTAGGVIGFTTATALGGVGTGTTVPQIQFNAGTLRNDATGSLVTAYGFSFGAEDNATTSPGGAVFSGQNTEFQGATSLYAPTSTSYQHTITVNNTTTLSGVFGVSTAGGSGATLGTIPGLTVAGTGTLVLSGSSPNTFTEPVTISGTATLNAAKTGALASNASVTVNSGGTLLLSGTGTGRLGTVPITLAGGTFATGGNSDSVGTLTLTAYSSLDFGAGSTTSSITFADSSSKPWTGGQLTLLNYTNSADVLNFGTSTTTGTGGGLTASQLSAVRYFDSSGTQYIGSGFDATGDVLFSPIPEPTTVLGGILLVAGAGWTQRRRLRAALAA